MKTPLNGKTFKRHMTYNWWKYFVSALLIIFIVDILFTTTAYRPPDSKKVQLFVYGLADTEWLNKYMENVRKTRMSDMEQMDSLQMTTDYTYGPLQLSTYVAAGEGDVYIVPKEQFNSMSKGGAFKPLEDDPDLLTQLEKLGFNLQLGTRTEADTGEAHLFGIPLTLFPGLSKRVLVDNGMVCVLINNGNDTNVMKFLNIFLADMNGFEPPDFSNSGSDLTPAPESSASTD